MSCPNCGFPDHVERPDGVALCNGNHIKVSPEIIADDKYMREVFRPWWRDAVLGKAIEMSFEELDREILGEADGSS